MKTIYNFLPFAFVVICLFSKCNNAPETKKPTTENKNTTTTTTNTNEKSPKFAFYNSDSVMLKYEFYKVNKKELETKQRILQADFSARQSQFENSVNAFQNSAGTMTASKIEETKQALGKKDQELREYGQTQEQNFIKQSQELNEKMSNNIAENVKKYAEANGYTFVFAYSKASVALGLVYAQESHNITDDIVKALNEEYKKK